MTTSIDRKGAGGILPRLVVIGSADQSATLIEALRRAGCADRITLAGTAGRITGALLGHAMPDIAVFFLDQDAGFSAEVRRECLMAWGAGAAPILVVDKAPGGSMGRRLRDDFPAWARRLGNPEPVWVDVAADPHALIAAIERCLERGTGKSPLRFWVETATPSANGVLVTGSVVAGQPVAPTDVVMLPEAEPAGLLASRDADGARTTLELDRTVDARPGTLIAAADRRPELADQIAAQIVWAGENPLLPGRPYRIRLGPQAAIAQISTLKHKINPLDLDPIAARQLSEGETGLCNLSFSAPLLFDPYAFGSSLGRFSLHDAASGTAVGYGRVAFTLRRATNIHWQALSVDKTARASLKHQQPCCLWLTGLSGSGKSTVASLLEKRLNAAGRHTYTLDGDNVRHGLNRDLGFTDADRVENIRRVGEVARLFVDAGLIVLVSFISPFRAERQMARELLNPAEFLEIFVDTPIEICERRDPKGLYKKARAGALKNFTGIDSPYEPPERPEIHLKGGEAAPETLVEQVLGELQRRGIV